MNIDVPRKGQIPALRALWREAFGDSDAFLDTFFATGFSPDRCRCIVEGGEAQAALYWYDCLHGGRPVAYLYAIATARAHRGKGLCRALMEKTHRHLADCGYAGALLVPGEASLFDFYAKMGYRVCSTVGEIACAAAPAPVLLHRLTGEEYAALRRRFLPPNGVLQEGKSIAFLEKQAALYAGEDFLLAARREGDALYGLELLGNAKAAPAALRALGCATGRFRIPAGSTPFAMYLAFDPQHTAPAYFGLAFD